MHRPPLFTAAVLAFGVSLAAASVARGQFEELLTRVPTEANAIVLFNVKKIHASTFGQQNDSAIRHQRAFESGLIYVPHHVGQFVMASQLDLEYLFPLWSVAVMKFDQPASLERLAEKIDHKPESLAGETCLELTDDAYLVQYPDQVFGVIAPGNRQQVARWVHAVRRREQPMLSPYLMEAAGYADKVGTEIILAVDLEHVLSLGAARRKLTESGFFQARETEIEPVAAVLATLRGATLGVRITERRYGSLKIDFGADAAALKEWGKPLLLNALRKTGAMIDDFESWEFKVDGTRMTLSGELSPSGMRRILSLVEPPTPSLAELAKQLSKPAEIHSPSEKYSTAEKTRDYYHNVTGMLSDLEQARRKVDNYSENSLWFNKYARAIDQLPLLGVDEEMVQFGAGVSGALRAATTTIQTMGIQTANRQAQIQPEFQGYAEYSGTSYGRYGAYLPYGTFSGSAYVDVRNVEGERRKVRAEEKAKAATDANSIMQQIDAASADMRRKMTAKYQIEF